MTDACGSAHHWARWLRALGIEVRLLPAPYGHTERLEKKIARSPYPIPA